MNKLTHIASTALLGALSLDPASAATAVSRNASYITTRDGVQLYSWVGTGCDEITNLGEREMRCSSLQGLPDADAIDTTEQIYVGVGELLTPGSNAADCSDGFTGATYGIYTSPDNEANIDPIGVYSIEADLKAPAGMGAGVAFGSGVRFV